MGYSLGPTVASLLLAVLPWPWLLGLQTPLGLAGWLLARRYLPRTDPAGADVPYDRVLALLSAVCFASLVFTLSAVAQQKSAGVVVASVALMLCSGVWLLRRQRGHAAPVLPVDLMAPVAGALSDRYPPAILGGVGLGILSAGMAGLGAVGLQTPLALMAPGAR